MPYEFLAKNGLISQGNITATGSLTVTQNITASNISASGTIIATSFTGSFSGSIGTAISATSASYALSASYAPTSTNITASWATNSLTASYLTPTNSYTIAGLTNNGSLSQQGTLSMGSGYQLLATTGTDLLPGISFVGDTNTGIYAPAADTLGFSISGSERVRIDSNGNVGIGTTSPGEKLSVISGSTRIASTSLAGALFLGNDNSNIYLQRDNSYDLSLVQNGDSNSSLYLASAGNVYVNIDSNNNDTDKAFIVQNNALKAGTELFRVSETGNVGIGSSSPGSKLEVIGGTNTRINLGNIDDVNRGGKLEIISGSVTARQFYVGTNSAIYNLVFGIDSIEKMRIDTAGNVGIGVTSPSGRLHITGSATSNESLIYLSKGSGSIVQNYITAVNQSGQNNYRVASDQNGHLGHDLYYSGTVKVSHNTYWPSWINNDSYTNGGLGIGTNSQTHGYGLTIAKPSTSGSLYVSGSTIITGSLNVSTNITCLSLTETSTQAVKYNILPLSSQLENVLKLKPVSFNYKTNNKHSIGLIAEEVAKIYPEFTSETNDSISYGKITSVLIQSIKELKNIIDNQQKQIEDLSNKLKQF